MNCNSALHVNTQKIQWLRKWHTLHPSFPTRRSFCEWGWLPRCRQPNREAPWNPPLSGDRDKKISVPPAISFSAYMKSQLGELRECVPRRGIQIHTIQTRSWLVKRAHRDRRPSPAITFNFEVGSSRPRFRWNRRGATRSTFHGISQNIFQSPPGLHPPPPIHSRTGAMHPGMGREHSVRRRPSGERVGSGRYYAFVCVSLGGARL